jgi:excisionase family DNA binding protein
VSDSPTTPDQTSRLDEDPAITQLRKELPPILSIRQVAELMSCSVDDVRGKIHSGELVARRWGQQFRVLREDLLEVLARPN